MYHIVISQCVTMYHNDELKGTRIRTFDWFCFLVVFCELLVTLSYFTNLLIFLFLMLLHQLFTGINIQ